MYICVCIYPRYLLLYISSIRNIVLYRGKLPNMDTLSINGQ